MFDTAEKWQEGGACGREHSHLKQDQAYLCRDFMTIGEGEDNFYKIVLPLPLAERNVSHLQNNPGYGE